MSAKKSDQNRYIGMAGEFRIMSELLLRGYNPAKPYLDRGADLILEDGCRIEVKSAHKGQYKDYRSGIKYDTYRFTFQPSYAASQRSSIKLNFDFVICWCIDDDIFYIIPRKEIPPQCRLSLTCSDGKKYTQFKNAWHLLSG